MNNNNYDENNDINVSPIQESDLNEPTLAEKINQDYYDSNGYSEKSEEDLLSERMVLTSLNGKKIDEINESIIPPEEYIDENYINQNSSEEVSFDFEDINISPENSVNNAVEKYDNLDSNLNDEVENTITITNLEQRILKEFIKDLSEDNDIISKEDLNDEIDFLDNPSIDNERLKFFVNQLSDSDSFDHKDGFINLNKFIGHKFSVPLSMNLKPDPSSDFINPKTNEKAKEEKKEREYKSENPSNEEKNRRIDLDKKLKEIEKKPEEKKQQQPGSNNVVKESILGAGIKMLSNRNNNKSKDSSVESSEELSAEDKIDGLNNDIKVLTKNFQSYNLMDDNDPNKKLMKQSIEKRMSEINDKMESNPISEEDLKSNPKKSQNLEKSTSRLNKNMKKTKNSEMDGLKDFKERMSDFFNKIKKVVTYVMSKIKGNGSNFTP